MCSSLCDHGEERARISVVSGCHIIARISHVSLTPGSRLGQYEVSARIGVGGMGEVYRAFDTVLERQVAIKVLPRSCSPMRGDWFRCRPPAECLHHFRASAGVMQTIASRSHCLMDAISCSRGLLETPSLHMWQYGTILLVDRQS